jgi:hypothetical protein
VRDGGATIPNRLDNALRLWKLGGDECCDFCLGRHDHTPWNRWKEADRMIDDNLFVVDDG